MKRALRIGLVPLFLVTGLMLYMSPPGGPRFQPVSGPVVPWPSGQISYDFLSPAPFEGGKMWITSYSTNRAEVLLFDIDQRRILGRLNDGWPVMNSGDQTKTLCSQPGPRFKDRLWLWLDRLSGGRLKSPSPELTPTYWRLDLTRNSAAYLGRLPEMPHSIFSPAPDFQHGFTLLDKPPTRVDLYVFDLTAGSMVQRISPGWPAGWWNNTQILCLGTNQDLLLYDIHTERSAVLIRADQIADFFRQNHLEAAPSQAKPFLAWRSRECDFYLTDTQQKWLATNSFLIKLERPDGRLKLVSANFKFGWSGQFDPTGRFYLYTGREPGQGSDGVFLRELATGTNRVLVPSTSAAYFSLPNFYRDSVIYVRSNELWRIHLDGSHLTRLFPPPQNP